MSGLILCQAKKAAHPLYIEELGIHIYTAEELCYVIYNHIFIIQEEQLARQLVAFAGEELGYMDGAARLYRRAKDSRNSDEVLIDLLKLIPYYTPGEIGIFREWLSKFRRRHPATQQVERADYYLERKRFLKAIYIYEEVLSEYMDSLNDTSFIGNVWLRLGNAYGAFFEGEKAKMAYANAYNLLGQKEILKRLYHVTLLFGGDDLPELIKTRVSAEELKAWEEEMDDIRMDVVSGDQVVAIHKQFQKDSIRRKLAAQELFGQWKEEYRRMI